MTELKTKIVEYRRDQNITQGDLADRVGVRARNHRQVRTRAV